VGGGFVWATNEKEVDLPLNKTPYNELPENMSEALAFDYYKEKI